MNTLTLTMDLKRLKSFFKEVDLLDYFFYLVILTFYIGKAFKPAVFLVDIVFLIEVYKRKDFWQRVDKFKALIWALFLFASYLIVQGLFLVDYRNEVLRSTFEEIMYIIMVIAAIYHFRTIEQLRRMIYVTWFIVTLVLLDAIYQYFSGHDLFGNPLTSYGHRLTAWKDKSSLGPMLGVFSGILLVAPFFVENRVLKTLGWIIAILLFIVIVLAGNRSPLLALFSALIFLMIITKYRKIILTVLAVFISVFLIVMNTNPALSVKYKALLNPTSNSATANRYHIILVALQIIKDHPVFGVGPGAYNKYHIAASHKIDWKKYKKYQVKYYMNHSPTHTHSVLLDIILSYGIVGFGLLLYWIYLFFKQFILQSEFSKLAALSFFYCITPLAFSKAFTNDVWQYMTYLSMVFVIAVAKAKESY